MTTKEILDYLHVQFPATVGHVPLEPMLERLALDSMKEGALRAAKTAWECGEKPLHSGRMAHQVILTNASNWTEADL